MAYYIENGTLFIDAGDPYLEHHGVLGMKWGKHLRAGKGPASAPASSSGGGGGAPEEDEETKKKIEEAAKKAGMTADEYRKKFADKVAEIKKAAYNAAGGSHKTEAAEYRKLSRDASNEARKYEASGNADLAKAASAKRKGDTSAHSSYKTTGDNAKGEARKAQERASALSEGARQEQARYEKSLAGRYDKMKADLARSKKIKQRQSIERALANGPVEGKPKKLGKRLEEKLGITRETTNKLKQSKEAKRIEDMYKDAARKNKAFSGTSPKEKKRVTRKDQYLALPEQKKRSRAYDNKAAEARRARAERLTRDSEIFNRAAEELKRKQNSALNKGNKQEAERHGKDANFAQNWAEEGRRGAKDWRTGHRTGKPVLRTDSLDQVKKRHDETLSGKLDKARYAIQRGKQKAYNAAGGKYKEEATKQKVLYDRADARMRRARKNFDRTGDYNYEWDRQEADSARRIHNSEAGSAYAKYRNSLAGRYDEFKAKRKKKAKHSDDTNAVYTKGTKLVINSKWG